MPDSRGGWLEGPLPARRGRWWWIPEVLLLIAFVAFVIARHTEEKQFLRLLRHARPGWLGLSLLLQLATYAGKGILLTTRGAETSPRINGREAPPFARESPARGSAWRSKLSACIRLGGLELPQPQAARDLEERERTDEAAFVHDRKL